MKKKSSFEKVRNVLFCVFLGVFLVSAAALVTTVVQRHKGNRIYEDVKDIFFSEVNGVQGNMTVPGVGKLEADDGYSTSPSISDRLNETENVEAAEPPSDTLKEEKKYNETLERVRAGLNSLREVNEDIYGWISVSGTSIDFPIVRGEDNDRYLTHAYNGDYSPLGSIFADYRCLDKITANYNTVLYGHNLMTGGADMFHDIEMFFGQEFFDSAQIIVYTFDGIYVYEPFSVYEARYDYNYYKIHFGSGEELVAFANAVKENSRCYSDIEFSPDDRLLTLSTCTNYEYFTRYALHAKLINAIEE